MFEIQPQFHVFIVYILFGYIGLNVGKIAV